MNIQELVSNEPMLLLYFKNDNCQPCMVLRPKIEQLIQSSFSKIKFIVLDIKHHPELVSEYRILSSPTILFFAEGKEYFRGGIYTSLDDLERKIERIYKFLA